MKVKTKIILSGSIVVFLAFSIATGVIYQSSSNTVETLVHQLAQQTAQKNSLFIQLELERIMEKARMLALTFVEMLETGETNRGLVDKILISATKGDPETLGSWTLWEPNAFDGQDKRYVNIPEGNDTGRLNVYWHWQNNQIVVKPNINWETSDYYQVPQKNRQETLLEPSFYKKVSGINTLMVSVVIPILHQGRFLGVVGVDYKLENLQKRVARTKIWEIGYSTLISYQGTMVSHPKPEYIGKNITQVAGYTLAKPIVQRGKHDAATAYSEILKTEVYMMYIPIFVGNSQSPWSLVISVPLDKIREPASQVAHYIMSIGTVAILFAILVLWLVVNSVTKPITQVTDFLRKITSNGSLLAKAHTLRVHSQDEVGELANAFNKMCAELHRQFRERIEAEAKVKREQEKFAMVLNSLEALVYVVDPQSYEILFINQYGQHIFGNSVEQGCWQFLQASQLGSNHKKLEETAREMQNPINGRWYYLHDRLIPWTDGRVARLEIATDITVIKQAEEQLRLAQFALDNSPDAVEWVNSQGQFIYVNQAECEALGYTHEELLKMRVPDVEPNVSLESWGTVWEVIKKEKVFTVETLHRRKAGQVFPVEIRGGYFHFDGKEYICVFARDITERKRVEEALRQSEERFALAVRATNEGIWDFNPQRGTTYFSPRFKEMVGFAEYEEFTLDDYLQNIHEDDLKWVVSTFRSYLEQKIATYDITYRLLHKQGHDVWTRARARAVWDEKGQAVRVVGIQADITAQRQAEEALRKSEERFELAMRGANDGLWDWNVETGEVYYSPRWKSMLGYRESEISTHISEFRRLLHPDDLEPILLKQQDYFDKKIPTYEAVFRMTHRQGHYVWILSRAFAVWNKAGKIMRAVGTHVDITAQKQAEEALWQAKEAAEIANQAKSTFLANMSHELRTPLNGILGYAQILTRDQNLTPKQREGVNIIQRSGEYLLTLINDVLDLAKIEAGRVELYPMDFHLGNFLQGLVDLFKMRAAQKGIAFTYQPLSTLPSGIHADEKRLRQVLINLLANAVKFTEQGGVTFKVDYHDHQLIFQVEDTGIGIAATDLQKIFQPFQQSGDGEYKVEGTGLGLSITERIVDMMGGCIQVDSALGKGSCFRVVLALPKTELGMAPETAPQLPVIIGFAGTVRKILVVDDKRENRAVIVNLLTPLGFEVVEAHDGQIGLEMAKQTLPELILVDLIMPMMDGFELVRTLRKLSEFAATPIIAISARVFDNDQQKSYEVGCNDFLPKPFRAEILLEKIQRHLGLHWVYDSPPAIKETTPSTEWWLPPESANFFYHLAMQGDIRGIREYAQQLAEKDQNLASFAFKINKLASNFEDEKIFELIEPFVTKPE